MSTPAAAEASALQPEASAEKTENTENRPQEDPEQKSEPTETQETTPSADANHSPSPSPSDSHSEGEYSGSDTSEQRDSTPLPDHDSNAPPLPNEPLPATNAAAPPLPAEPVPEAQDDGWEFHWNPNDQSYWFYNRFTGAWQKDNPRVLTGAPGSTSTPADPAPTAPAPPPEGGGPNPLSNPTSVAGGYNPAIHGDYDENAWYAQAHRAPATTTPGTEQGGGGGGEQDYGTAALFNRHTGQWQTAEQGAERHSDEAKSRRQMRAFFDVDAAANMHDGRSLKAERSGIKPSRSELKAFKEKRRAKKEEKRRAWLRD
ncbi:hypothetical protein C8A00DRAFT_11213 [Chaetomidium leptoderma]|uniref:WW domain-containing protein n=1 Tax=Chaetomidium leptoderma TaxID=669021 RepID=A0AAN6VUF7_9PEZI|nr:hypothetical protein C8A00DRAFT_11213 [Chaetomidium leptoderma]